MAVFLNMNSPESWKIDKFLIGPKWLLQEDHANINQSINRRICNAHYGRRIESNLRRGQWPGGWGGYTLRVVRDNTEVRWVFRGRLKVTSEGYERKTWNKNTANKKFNSVMRTIQMKMQLFGNTSRMNQNSPVSRRISRRPPAEKNFRLSRRWFC